MDETPPTPPPRKWVQVNTTTLILLVALIASWVAVWIHREQIAVLETRIASASNLARELVVDDPTQAAVVKRLEEWSDDQRWKVYLPPGDYRLCLATREIDGKGLAPVAGRVAIGGGSHDLAYEQTQKGERWEVVVSVDGAPVLRAEESSDWNLNLGSLGTDGHSVSRQFAMASPLPLLRTRFRKQDARGATKTPDGPTEGILLWIEPAAPDALRAP